ncbi:MAG: GtrA family protein [Alphaproteobacteria bacterium]|nr:GtrA family protein [Alphaproteobacteria bacterium]
MGAHETVRTLRAHAPRVTRFALVGLVCAAVDFSLFALLVGAGAPPVLANIPSFMTANVAAYFLHARVTFRRGGAPAGTSFTGYARFFGAYVFSLVLSTTVVGVFSPRFGPLPAKLGATGLAAASNYLANHFLVFRTSEENERAGGPAESA